MPPAQPARHPKPLHFDGLPGMIGAPNFSMEPTVKLEHLAQMRALESAYASTGSRLVDFALRDGGSGQEAQLPLKRIQFDAWEGLAVELEKVCELLDCSKREFLEAAVVDAIGVAMGAYRSTLDRVREDDAGPQASLLSTYVEG
jgi:hypothetical protein